MTRKQERLERLRAIEREYEVAFAAAEGLNERLRQNPSALDDERLRFRDYRNFRENLEPTYLIRILAEFEAGLREAWRDAYQRTTQPPLTELIESIAAQCLIPEDWRDRAHEVRAYRNTLVHEGAVEASTIEMREARGHLCRFLSQLPHDW